jgi:hypothetical protein
MPRTFHERTPQVVLAALRPTVVVVGMAYRMQAQLAEAFRYAGGGGEREGAHAVVGVEDAFALWDWHSLAATAFLPIVTEFVLLFLIFSNPYPSGCTCAIVATLRENMFL